MIRIPLISKAILPKPSKSPELKELAASIQQMANTPEWQAYLTGLKTIENRKKTKASKNGNNPNLGKHR